MNKAQLSRSAKYGNMSWVAVLYWTLTSVSLVKIGHHQDDPQLRLDLSEHIGT